MKEQTYNMKVNNSVTEQEEEIKKEILNNKVKDKVLNEIKIKKNE